MRVDTRPGWRLDSDSGPSLVWARGLQFGDARTMLRPLCGTDWGGSSVLGYLDPGAGSMILQALAAGIAGLAVTGKLYWGRIKRALRFGRHDPAPDEPAP
jgi:hypothetical protein